MSENIEEEKTDYSEYPKPSDLSDKPYNDLSPRPLIGFGVPYVGFNENSRFGAFHVYNERVSTQEDVRIDFLKISVKEASAMNLSGIAKVYPSGDYPCGYGIFPEEQRENLFEFTFEFDPDKFKTAQEVYDAWKISVEGEA
jgi:hypothetical protein